MKAALLSQSAGCDRTEPLWGASRGNAPLRRGERCRAVFVSARLTCVRHFSLRRADFAAITVASGPAQEVQAVASLKGLNAVEEREEKTLILTN